MSGPTRTRSDARSPGAAPAAPRLRLVRAPAAATGRGRVAARHRVARDGSRVVDSVAPDRAELDRAAVHRPIDVVRTAGRELDGAAERRSGLGPVEDKRAVEGAAVGARPLPGEAAVR